MKSYKTVLLEIADGIKISVLKEEYLLDVGSHILYSPLPCRIPLPGFERFRVCVSQYEEKDRQLLRNLCFVLGAKFAEKLTKKVTHLLCKFTNGPKYDYARKWGIHSITSEWIYECIRQVCSDIVCLCCVCVLEGAGAVICLCLLVFEHALCLCVCACVHAQIHAFIQMGSY